jgi:hypothetical protein
MFFNSCPKFLQKVSPENQAAYTNYGLYLYRFNPPEALEASGDEVVCLIFKCKTTSPESWLYAWRCRGDLSGTRLNGKHSINKHLCFLAILPAHPV